MNKTELIRMDNGLSVITCSMPNMQSVSTVVGIRSGSIYENNAQMGISHFIEHMLFKGTKNRKNTLEISQCIEQLGGEINASTSEECTFVYTKVLYKNFPNAFEVMADILNHSLFREEDIAHEKLIIVEEINKYQDIPEDWIGFLINQLLWKGTVLSQNVLGEKKTVNQFTRNAILQYFDEMYKPKNIVISITGNISAETVQKVINNSPFVPKKTKTKETPEIQLKNQQFPEIMTIPKKVNQSHLCFGFEGVSRFHSDKISMDLLNIILGGGLSSRLFQEIRVNYGLAYDIHSYTQYFDKTGSFNIYAGVDSGKIDCTVEKILAELRKIKNNKISSEELHKAKEIYKGDILLGLESTLNRAFRMGSHLLLYGKEYRYQELIEKIESVRSEDISKVAQNVFLTNKVNLVIFYPTEIEIKKDDLMNKIEI
jgi:predicted Zn-dependent peptidase